MKLSDHDMSLLKGVFDDMEDRLRHYGDAEMGWDEDDVDNFNSLYGRFHDEAKRRKFWWAR